MQTLLQEAIEYNKYDWLVDEDNRPHGLLGIQPTRSVTFVDNHDTGSTQAHWPFPKDKKLEGYAYIMTHPGMPTVFWEHLYDVRSSSRCTAGLVQCIAAQVSALDGRITAGCKRHGYATHSRAPKECVHFHL